MENKQINKLKLNATNIKNTLFKSNNELIRLKKDRLKISFEEGEKKKFSKKESSLEKGSSFLQSVKNVGKTLISGPLNLIDKFKEFFGLLLLGIVVNNLPAIVKKLQDVFTKIQTFLDQNPWIMDSVKFGFEMIGKGIMGLAKFIRFIGPYVGGSFKFALDTLKSARIQVETLISTFDDLNLSFGKLANDLNIDKIPDVNKDPSNYSNFVAGGGKKALKEKGLTVDEVVEQGKKNISRYDSGSRAPSTKLPEQGYTPYQPKPPEKFARGGTVGNIPPQEGTFRGGPSDIAKKKYSAPSTNRSPFTKSESGNARRARQSVNYFETFNKTLNDVGDNTILEEKNIKSFEKMTFNFKEFSRLMEKQRSNSNDPNDPGDPNNPSPGSPGGNFTGTAADIPPEGKALLDAIAGAEAPGYNVRYGGATFNSYADHPRKSAPTPKGGTSDAAGRYQFKSETWDKYKTAKAFTPENQDVAAWRLAIAVYGKGEDGIVKDLQKDPMKVASNLTGTWPSLPEGSQQNNATSGFLSRYQAAVKKYKALTTRPTTGAFRNVLPQGNPQFSSGFRTSDRPEHKGMDIGVDVHSPVIALQSGKVRGFYSKFGKYGSAVIVEHPDKTQLIYGHVAPSSELKVGDPIQKGQVIAKVVYYKGPRGENYTHLHLERVVNGQWVNPVPFLNSVENSRVKESRRNNQYGTANEEMNRIIKALQGEGGNYSTSEEIVNEELYELPIKKIFNGNTSLLPIDKGITDLTSGSNNNLSSTTNVVFQPIVYEKYVPYPLPVG